MRLTSFLSCSWSMTPPTVNAYYSSTSNKIGKCLGGNCANIFSSGVSVDLKVVCALWWTRFLCVNRVTRLYLSAFTWQFSLLGYCRSPSTTRRTQSECCPVAISWVHSATVDPDIPAMKHSLSTSTEFERTILYTIYPIHLLFIHLMMYWFIVI